MTLRDPLTTCADCGSALEYASVPVRTVDGHVAGYRCLACARPTLEEYKESNMRAKMIRRTNSNTYQIEQSGEAPFRVAVRGLKRRTDIEGLIEGGGPGGDNLMGRAYEDQWGGLLVRVG